MVRGPSRGIWKPRWGAEVAGLIGHAKRVVSVPETIDLEGHLAVTEFWWMVARPGELRQMVTRCVILTRVVRGRRNFAPTEGRESHGLCPSIFQGTLFGEGAMALELTLKGA